VTQSAQPDLDSDVARLYSQGRTRAQIAELLDVRMSEVREILAGLFAQGMPRIARRMTDAQVRAIYAAYQAGASIDRLAEAIGFTGSAARRQIHNRKLSLERRRSVRVGKTGARGERELITGLLLLTRVDELRDRRSLTIEDLAQASGLSMSTLKGMRVHLSDPKLSTILKLCRGLGISPCEFVGDLPLPEGPVAAIGCWLGRP
jgi:DNA-binding Xre family transcriptional regulator